MATPLTNCNLALVRMTGKGKNKDNACTLFDTADTR